MKTSLITLSVIFALFISYFFILGFISKSKIAPGIINGQLSKCPDSPNCFCSEFKEDKNHYIAPIKILHKNTSSVETKTSLTHIINKMGGTIQKEDKNYVAATFTSTFFRFVDDLEIRIDHKQNVIHLRSASRVGRGDFGVNKKRLDSFKKIYRNLTPAADYN